MADGSSDVSLDSVTSSTAGDVLIRSTSIERSRGAPRRHRDGAEGIVHSIPPALPANKPQGAPRTERNVEQLPHPKTTDTRLLDQVYLNPDSKGFPGRNAPLKKNEEGSRREAGDICISQYIPGQKEAMRACLKQRLNDASASKEVRVQLLQDIATEKRENTSKSPACADLDSAGIIAAATAAAIATAAPLLKAQSDLDTKIGSVSELIHRLQANQLLQHSTEQQTKIKAHSLDGQHYRNRVGELEKQLGKLMEQRMQHLETLQKQQMDIQSHFISSAINTSSLQGVRTHAVCANPSIITTKPGQQRLLNDTPFPHRDVVPITEPPTHVHSTQLGDSDRFKGKSPLETPAPRRFAPVPMSKDVSVPLKDQLVHVKENVDGSKFSTNLEKGRFLEQILGHQESPVIQSKFCEKTPVTRTKISTCQEGDSLMYPTESGAALGRTFQGIKQLGSTGSAAVQKADDVLHEIGQLKKEMQGMLQSIGSSGPALVPDSHQFTKTSLLQMVEVPKSMFEDAERTLQEVKNDKKVLENNLEAVTRAKDGAAMYSLISALTTNGDAVKEIRIKSTVDAWIKEISTEIQDEILRKEYESVKYDQKDKYLLLKKKEQNIRHTKVNQERSSRILPTTISNTKKPLSTSTVKSFLKQSEDISRRSNLRTELQKKEGRSKASTRTDEIPHPTEEHLSQLYGKPIYQSHRSTLKKGPYLRFNSPSPKSKPLRPKVVECVRGVKLKSARTQTSNSSLKALITSPKPPYSLSSQVPHDNQYVFSPSREMPAFSGLVEGHLIPMAIPLGQSRIDVAAPHPTSVIVMRPHSATVTTSVPPSLPKLQPKVQKPNIAIIEMKSEKKDPPTLTVQVLPSVDIDSIAGDSTDTNVRSSSPELMLPPVPAETVIQTPELVEHEEDYIAFPGTDFVGVTDISQDQEKEEEVPEALLEYNGWSEPVSYKYSGLPFPPTAPAPQPTSDVLDEIIERRETLENRLISWVEQEIMARIINGMYPVQRETVPNTSVSDSEESASPASDIVDAVGGEGLQLFVSAGVPVDSDLIRQFVNEAIAETVAVMLGEREERRVASVPASTRDLVDTAARTPLATPQCTPPLTPTPPETEHFPIKTPVLSPQSCVSEDDESKQKTTIKTEPQHQEVKSLVGTPAVTPVSTPPRVATPTPPLSEKVSYIMQMPSPKQPTLWGDVELPLEEENPCSVKEEALHPKPIVMSVAKDEEPESLVSAAYSNPDLSSVSLPCAPRSPSPVRLPSSSPTTEESSLTVTITETETQDRSISEGEVLYSYGQMVAARALAEGGLMFNNVSTSLSSTLRDAHEMDYDPPSEGQVIQRPHRGHHRDPVLSLLVQLNQAPIVSQEIDYNPENSEDDNSLGELSEGQRPRFSIAAESILLGHSVYMDQPGQATKHRSRPASSPGQCDRLPGAGFGESDASPGPMSLGELEIRPTTFQQATQINETGSTPITVKDISQDQRPGIPFVEPKPAPARIIHVGIKGESPLQQGSHRDLDRTLIEPSVYLTSLHSGGAAEPPSRLQTIPGRMSVTMPSLTGDDLPKSVYSLNGDTDSSGTDTF